MGSEKLYLRDEVYFEPLFNGWYAWPYLAPPEAMYGRKTFDLT
jgi:hypothetical protein